MFGLKRIQTPKMLSTSFAVFGVLVIVNAELKCTLVEDTNVNSTTARFTPPMRSDTSAGGGKWLKSDVANSLTVFSFEKSALFQITFVSNTLGLPYILTRGVVSDSNIYTDITLQNCHLINIEVDAFENDFNLRHVDLSSNKISNLHPSVLDGSFQLTHLNLSHNWLQDFQPGLFIQKPNVEVLDLRGNQIFSLPEDIFVPLRQLVHVDLSANEFKGKDLSSFIFDKNRKIKHMDLSGNDMLDSPENLFRSLIELDYLNLNRCSLKEIPRFATKSNLKTIRHLILSTNQITAIDRTSLISLEYLEILDLSENLIGYIDANAFISLKKINSIILKSNKLKTLPDGFFRNLANLEVVDLSHNLLEYIAYSAFRGTALKNLDLSNNRFSYMDSNFCLLLRNYGVRLTKVNFDNNPWQCACLNDILIEMKTYDIEYNSGKFNGLHPVCVTTKTFTCQRQSLENQRYVNMYEDAIVRLSPVPIN